MDTVGHQQLMRIEPKLPDFIDEPLNEFIDSSFELVSEAQGLIKSSIPIECASVSIRQDADRNKDMGQALVDAVAKEVENKIRKRLEQEAREWIEETALETVAASIPSGGIGGAAALSTSLVQLVYRIHQTIEPIIKIANEVKDVAEDLGFSANCKWGVWKTL